MKHLLEQLMRLPEAGELLRRVEDGGCPAAVTGLQPVHRACLGAAVALGLPLSWNLPAAVAALIPSALLFIALGLLCGTLFNDKQVGGMCGALLTNVTAFLAGIWFDLSLMGGEFKSFAYLLPFAHGADAAKAALAGEWAALPGHLLWVSAWAAALMALAVWLFRRKLTEQ